MSKRPTPAPAGQFGLFEAAPLPTPAAAPAPAATQVPPAADPPPAHAALLSLNALSDELLHPYSRYGLAVAAEQGRLPDALTEAALREALIEAIETGLGEFRMRTWNDPAHDEVLTYEAVKRTELLDDAGLVSGKLSAKGFFLFPTIITVDTKAADTFGNALRIIKLLKSTTTLHTKSELGRSFAPTTGKINNGTASQSVAKGTLLEAACSLISTVTQLKAAAWIKRANAKKPSDIFNTCILPDLPWPQLRRFIELFALMTGTQTNRNELLRTRAKASPAAPKAPVKSAKKAKEPAKDETTKAPKPPKSEFRRPRLHSGNYPDAPREAGTFGPVGLLGAIGRWARQAHGLDLGRAVLDSLAEQPLLLISYEQISQVRFSHHVTRLALAEDLTGIVDALYLRTLLYSELGSPGTPFGKPNFKLYCLIAGRFLQSFSPPAFADFLAFRAEYDPRVAPLFTEYFRTMNPKIVESASALGRWLNRTAYFVAKDDLEKTSSKDKTQPTSQQVKERKAKILVVLESAVLSAKTPEEMVSQVLIQAGRLSFEDAPHEALRFINAANSREITPEQAKHLLTAYMRLQGPRREKGSPEADEADDAVTADAPTEINHLDQ